MPDTQLARTVLSAIAIDATVWTTAAIPLVVATSLMVVFAAVLRASRWRGVRRRGNRSPEFLPPTGIDMIAAGGLMRRPTRSLLALFVSLTARGFLRMAEASDPYNHLQRTELRLQHADGLDGQELRIIRLLFGASPTPGAHFELMQLPYSLLLDLNAEVQNAPADAMARGWRQPITRLERDTVRVGAGAIVIGTAAVLISMVAAPGAVPGDTALQLLGAGAIATTAVAVAPRGPALTAAGAEHRHTLLAVRDFLRLDVDERVAVLRAATAQRRSRVDPNDLREIMAIHENLMPLAVLFRLHGKWSKELEMMSVRAGTTWDGHSTKGMFASHSFRRSMFLLTRRMRVNPDGMESVRRRARRALAARS